MTFYWCYYHITPTVQPRKLSADTAHPPSALRMTGPAHPQRVSSHPVYALQHTAVFPGPPQGLGINCSWSFDPGNATWGASPGSCPGFWALLAFGLGWTYTMERQRTLTGHFLHGRQCCHVVESLLWPSQQSCSAHLASSESTQSACPACPACARPWAPITAMQKGRGLEGKEKGREWNPLYCKFEASLGYTLSQTNNA